jgi:type I restriction enzyme S subunit
VASQDNIGYKIIRNGDFTYRAMTDDDKFCFNQLTDFEIGIVSPAYFVYGFSDDDYNPRYFHYFMRNANNIPEYRRLSGGIREGQWDLSPYDLGNMPVIVPPKAEQNEIVAFLDEKCAAIEQSIADKQTQIETLKAYKSSLIYEYVTGKKQVI